MIVVPPTAGREEDDGYTELRFCFGRFATGVTVVTYEFGGGPHGITVNSFTSVSLDPPLLLGSIDRRAKACNSLDGAPFTVNVLTSGQQELAMHFAGRPQPDVSLEWEMGERAPRLFWVLAWMECVPWRRYDGGDHVLYTGKIIRYDYCDDQPLIFFTGNFGILPFAAKETRRAGRRRRPPQRRVRCGCWRRQF
ncbi:flavin reductase [Kyrpidia spormannii]|uniref:Flavin reductase n=1 Tax=Kyrpidia spormannii TaxID=2055160 RepID=A0A2K8N4U5_9BACL|nr:flavin reductase family protein [Kyrpidia spormannii]ATY84095.1 flavin reductase [Kyrpidia spormannii]